MFSPEFRSKAQDLVNIYPESRSALLPLLHLVQHYDGYISDEGVTECAEILGMTKAEIAAVSTFYTMYKSEEMGKHLVSICTNFACTVRGGKEVYDKVSEHLGVGHDETTEDKVITLEHAECLGNCEGAPVVTVDYMNYESQTPQSAIELMEALRAGNPPQPTRGMIPPGIRAMSHRLSGHGPIDPNAPGQTVGEGLADKHCGATVYPNAGPDGGGVTTISLTPQELAAAAVAINQNTPASEGDA